MKRLIALLLGFTLASCDSSTKEADGTSSETQTALQALADSLSTIRIPDQPTLAVAGRAATDSGWIPLTYRRIHFGYGIDDQGKRYSYRRTLQGRTDGTGLITEDTIRWISEDLDLTSTQRWVADSTGSTKSSFVGQEGLSRTGFRFRSRPLNHEDWKRFPLDSLGISAVSHGIESRLYSFEGGWELVMQGDPPFQLPVFRDGELKGWLEPAGSGWSIPIEDFSMWRIRGLDGTLYRGRELPRAANWVGDSMGVFYGLPRPDSSGTKLLLPFRWRFFQGTVAAAGGQHSPEILDQGEDSLFRVDGFSFSADEGSSTAIAYGAIRDGIVLPRQLRTDWYSETDSGRVEGLRFFLDIPEMQVGGASGSIRKVSP